MKRLSAGLLAAFFAWPSFAQSAADTRKMKSFEGLVVPLESPFYRDLLDRPLPQGRAELDALAFVFDRTGHRLRASLLRDWGDRIDLRKMLGEPLERPETLREAISEKTTVENIFEARKRTMGAMLRLEPMESTADDLRYDKGPSRYLGDSVWRGGHSDRLVWVRVRATNRFTEPIQSFRASMRFSNQVLLSFECKAAEGGELPPNLSVAAVCLDNADDQKPDAAVEKLRRRPLALELDSIYLRDRYFGEGSHVQPRGLEYLQEVQRRAREMIEATPCEAMLACQALAKHEAEEAARNADPRIELERQRVQAVAKRERQKVVATLGVIAAIVGVVGMGMLGREWRPASRGWFPSVIAVLAVASGLVFGTATLVALTHSNLGFGGFLLIAAWGYAGPVLAISTLLLGIALIDRARRSIPRMASLGFALSVVALFAVSLYFI